MPANLAICREYKRYSPSLGFLRNRVRWKSSGWRAAGARRIGVTHSFGVAELCRYHAKFVPVHNELGTAVSAEICRNTAVSGGLVPCKSGAGLTRPGGMGWAWRANPESARATGGGSRDREPVVRGMTDASLLNALTGQIGTTRLHELLNLRPALR